MTNKNFMRLAIDKARENKTPFAACIAGDGKAIACEASSVSIDNDPTSHGEVHAIRSACRKLKKPDLHGYILYTTCQPCAMCLMACYWAGIDKVVYGATLADSKKAGFHELDVSGKLAKQIVGNRIKLHGRVMKRQCLTLFKEFGQA